MCFDSNLTELIELELRQAWLSCGREMAEGKSSDCHRSSCVQSVLEIFRFN